MTSTAIEQPEMQARKTAGIPTAGYRCYDGARKHPRRIPTVAIMIDGVLARTSQFAIDQMCISGLEGFHGVTDSKQLSQTLAVSHCDSCHRNPHCIPRQDPDAQLVKQLISSRPWSWLEIEPYDDVDFEGLHSAMETGEFLGYFLAHRFFLDTDDFCADPRYLSRAWLKKQNRGQFDAHSVVADLCKGHTVAFLKEVGVDFFLTDSIDQVIDARIEGIGAYLIDRPWNHDTRIPFRVHSVSEFLDLTVYKQSGPYTNN